MARPFHQICRGLKSFSATWFSQKKNAEHTVEVKFERQRNSSVLVPSLKCGPVKVVMEMFQVSFIGWMILWSSYMSKQGVREATEDCKRLAKK
jgi:hypothetical protein